MEVHADRVLDHLRRTRLRIRLLGVLRLEVLLHVLLADDLNAERLEDLEVFVGLDRIHDVGREDLIQLLVSDVAAVRLAAALHVLNHVVQLRLAENGHTLHRRKDRVSVGRIGRVGLRRGSRHQDRNVGVGLVNGLGRALRLGAFDLGGQKVGVELRGLNLDLLRRQIVPLGDIVDSTHRLAATPLGLQTGLLRLFRRQILR